MAPEVKVVLLEVVLRPCSSIEQANVHETTTYRPKRISDSLYPNNSIQGLKIDTAFERLSVDEWISHIVEYADSEKTHPTP